MTIETDKAGLLAAVAAAGTKGAEDYKAAQAQLAAQQADAVRMALANGVASNAPQGALDEVSRIISQPYQNRQAQLTSNAAGSADFFGKLGASADTFMTQANALIPAIQEQYRLSQQGSGGGGGGSEKDVWDALRSDFGTLGQAKEYFGSQTASNERGALPGWYGAQQAALGYGLEPAQVQALGIGPDGLNKGMSQFIQDTAGELSPKQQKIVLRGTMRTPLKRGSRMQRLVKKYAPAAKNQGQAGNNQADINLIRQQWGL